MAAKIKIKPKATEYNITASMYPTALIKEQHSYAYASASTYVCVFVC